MNPAKKYICIHGHFYQPPRENAWLEVVEKQDSAAPYHDWNERINFECYAPNASARILDDSGMIRKIVNNYAQISFNMGPTLLSWLAANDAETYLSILEADEQSRLRFGGHGSALAQAYSHMIMPLANRRDKETQIKWGLADFEHRFRRKAEGIWLAETAVDTETLEICAEHGIKFVPLAPRQAKAFRKIGDENWTPLGHAEVDPRRPYLYKLPSGKSIVLYFYDGNVAQDVAFKGLLNDGRALAQRLTQAIDNNDEPQLVHIGTDGESYGHHHRHGEMALAACYDYIEENNLATLTNYGEYLELFPPEYEIQIHENSSWSCVHGVERWRSNCGCNTGGQHGWNQAWRAPLRESLDWLRDKLIPIFEKEAGYFFDNPWAARDAYIQVILDRKNNSVDAFFEKYAKRKLNAAEEVQSLRLFEMQRHAMLMYTSCAWFFSEVSGIETIQVLQYANRAIHYAQQVSGADFHPEFVDFLEKTPSNKYENAAVAYRKEVQPAQVDLQRVAMHYAASSLFEEYPEHLEFFNYTAFSEDFIRRKAGNYKLAIGRTTLQSKITHSNKHFSFAVLYLGQQNMIGYVSLDMKRTVYDEMKVKLIESFESTNLGNVIGEMQAYFGNERFTIWHLFRDEKRKILEEALERSLAKSEMAVRELYNDNYQLMAGMLQSNIPIPESWKNAAQFIINIDFLRLFEQENLSLRELKHLAGEFKKWDISISSESKVKLVSSERIYKEMEKVYLDQATLEDIQRLNTFLKTLSEMGIKPDIWKSQNVFFSKMKGYKNQKWVFLNDEWRDAFYELGRLLRVRSV